MADWPTTLRLIPGYDPYRDAGDCVFDEQVADDAVAFFAECLRHIEGERAGHSFDLEPWQRAIVGNLFGWKRPDGTRRYRESLLYVPRKNGKTPLAAGIAALVLFADDERGQQNICAAADTDQATLLFRQIAGMIEQEPELQSRATIFRGVGQRSIEANKGYFKVVSSDAGTKHGGNLHLGIIDELHAQQNRDLFDVIRTSMASKNRRQPLLLSITTADYARESICNEVYEYACKVRDGIITDAAFLPVIYEAGRDDDWTAEAVWEKANPNIDVSVSREYLQRECAKAKETPAYENTFKRLHLNIVTEQDVRWLPMDAWDACPVDLPDLTGRECWAGLDLSTTTDLTACVLVFKGDDCYYVLPYFWVPREGAAKRERKDRVPYTTWIRQGLIEATDGDVVDYDVIRKRINELRAKYNIRELVADRWNATQILTQLAGDGFTVAQYGQGFRDMTAPAKELEAAVVARKLHHGGHPVLRWMASNATAELDAAGNIKPSKAKSVERIDGIVALCMGLGRAMVAVDTTSVYETRGIRTL